MANTYTQVDLSALPVPDVIEPLGYENILAQMLADLRARDTQFNALVEGDPAFVLLEVCAYRELLLRQRVNDACRAVMLAYANGADLDNLAANVNLQRLVLVEADPTTIPPTEAIMESDTAFRRRIQLVFESFTTAGSEGSYIFHALSADASVKDVSVASPTPGNVVVTVLSHEDDGTPSPELLDAVEAALNVEEVRPLTDIVAVQAATLVDFTVEAELIIKDGADAALIVEDATDALNALLEETKMLGQPVALSAIYSALHQANVVRVELAQPAADIILDPDEAPNCTLVDITYSVVS